MKRLYIIGNGFDLHHGIPSYYGCFKCYLKRTDCIDYIHIFEYLADENSLWSNFEKSLGTLDSSKFEKFIELYKKIDVQQRGLPDYIARQNAIDTIYSSIGTLFREWINSLNFQGVNQKVNICIEQSIFLNFNYTPTLEKVYKVSRNNIRYIHNTLDDELIFGHGLTDLEIDKHTGNINDAELRTEFKSLMKALRKDTDGIIRKNQDFFNALNGILEVFVLGHSLSDVDMPYFKQIKENVSSEALWTVSIYDDSSSKERSEKEARLNKIGIESDRLKFKKLNEI